MTKPIYSAAALVFALAVPAQAWDGFVCNYTDQTVTVKFNVQTSEPVIQTVQPESNSTAFSIAGLCFGGIDAWVAINGVSVEVPIEPWGLAAQACSNRVVMVFDRADQDIPAALRIHYTPGVNPTDTCLQP